MPSASSWIAARTMSATLRLWPRCTTSAPRDCSRRRIMLIAASWPSNSDAALTKRSGASAALWSGVRATDSADLCGQVAAGSPAPLEIVTDEYAQSPRDRITPTRTGHVKHTAAAHASALAAAGRKRAARDHALKREAVIRAAARAFHARGYHNTSLDDVAATLRSPSRRSTTTCANKEQLLFECFLAGLAADPRRRSRVASSRPAPAASGCSR